MSPEQARGEEVDARTDHFSLGAVLYEMATGSMAFSGNTSAVTFDAILNRDPLPLEHLNPDTPAELKRIIEKALEKDRELRYQAAAELRADLKRLKRDLESSKAKAAMPAPEFRPATAAPAGRWRLAIIVSFFTLALVLAVGIGFREFEALKPAGLPTISQRQLTTTTAENPLWAASISPNGKYLIYSEEGGAVYLRLVETGETNPIAVPSGIGPANFSWYPDGTKVLITAAGEAGHAGALWILSIVGAPPRKVRDGGWGGMVSPDGSRIAFINGIPGREVWVAGPNGESPQRIAALSEGAFHTGSWSPDGRFFAYVREQRVATKEQTTIGARERYVGGDIQYAVECYDAQTGQIARILEAASLGIVDPASTLWWLPDWRLLVVLTESPPRQGESNLWELPIARGSAKPSGQPRRLTDWTGFLLGHLSATADGKQLSLVKGRLQSDVYIGRLEAGAMGLSGLQRLTLDERNDRPSEWAPDSAAVYFYSDRNGTLDIFRQGADQRLPDVVALGPEDERVARLSPDGTYLLYWASSPGSDQVRLMRAPVAGGLAEPVLTAPANSAFRCSRSPTAACVLSEEREQQTVFHALDPLKGKGHQLARVPFRKRNWALSPEGSRVAMAEFEVGDNLVDLIDLRDGTARELEVAGWSGFNGVSWTSDGKALYLTSWSPRTGAALLLVDLHGRARALQRWSIFINVYDPIPSPDGRRLALSVESAKGNAWLLENF